jgi:hypothetical protein
MNLPADAVLIVSSGCNKKIQRLHSRIAAALEHNIVQFSVRLGMQLIKYNAWVLNPCLFANPLTAPCIYCLSEDSSWFSSLLDAHFI